MSAESRLRNLQQEITRRSFFRLPSSLFHLSDCLVFLILLIECRGGDGGGLSQLRYAREHRSIGQYNVNARVPQMASASRCDSA